MTKTGPGGGSITLTYDALGRKYRKTTNGAMSDYLQGIEYKDGKLEAIYAPEGRLAAVYDGNGVAITHYRAEYWLKGINSASTGFGQGTKAVEWSYAAKLINYASNFSACGTGKHPLSLQR